MCAPGALAGLAGPRNKRAVIERSRKELPLIGPTFRRALTILISGHYPLCAPPPPGEPGRGSRRPAQAMNDYDK